MFELIKNIIFFCIFLALGITSLILSKALKNALKEIKESGGRVNIQTVDFKLIFKWLLSLSISSTIGGFISAIYVVITIYQIIF